MTIIDDLITLRNTATRLAKELESNPGLSQELIQKTKNMTLAECIGLFVKDQDIYNAVSNGNSKWVDYLIKAGADFRDKQLLHVAAAGGHSDTIKVLLKAYCQKYQDENDVHIKNKNKIIEALQPLHSTLKQEHFKKTIQSFEHPYIDERDSDGATPLHLAAKNGHSEAARILLIWGAHPNSLHKVKKQYLEEEVSQSEEYIPSSYGITYEYTPLHYAIIAEKVDAIKVLMNYGADSQLSFYKCNNKPLNIVFKKFEQSVIACKHDKEPSPKFSKTGYMLLSSLPINPMIDLDHKAWEMTREWFAPMFNTLYMRDIKLNFITALNATLKMYANVVSSEVAKKETSDIMFRWVKAVIANGDSWEGNCMMYDLRFTIDNQVKSLHKKWEEIELNQTENEAAEMYSATKELYGLFNAVNKIQDIFKCIMLCVQQRSSSLSQYEENFLKKLQNQIELVVATMNSMHEKADNILSTYIDACSKPQEASSKPIDDQGSAYIGISNQVFKDKIAPFLTLDAKARVCLLTSKAGYPFLEVLSTVKDPEPTAQNVEDAKVESEIIPVDCNGVNSDTTSLETIS